MTQKRGAKGRKKKKLQKQSVELIGYERKTIRPRKKKIQRKKKKVISYYFLQNIATSLDCQSATISQSQIKKDPN